MESGGFEGLGTACTLPTGMGSKSIYTNYLRVCIQFVNILPIYKVRYNCLSVVFWSSQPIN